MVTYLTSPILRPPSHYWFFTTPGQHRGDLTDGTVQLATGDEFRKDVDLDENRQESEW
jgi:hypothetical protein